MIKKRIYAAIAVLLFTMSGFVLNIIYSLAGDTEIRLGEYNFFIPAEYTPDGFRNLSARWFTSYFQSEEVAVFVIPEEELSANISGYRMGEEGASRNIKGLIRVWTEEQSHHASHAANGVWDSGSGGCVIQSSSQSRGRPEVLCAAGC